MSERRDKLGRRIPVFDRSAAAHKGVKIKKERYGSDFYVRAGSIGGRARGRGYLGKLKDEGKTAELKALSEKATAARKAKNSKTSSADEGGHNTPVSGG